MPHATDNRFANLTVHDFGPRERAPRLVLIAGRQPQAFNGRFVAARLAGYLHDLAGTREDALADRILVIPAVSTPSDDALVDVLDTVSRPAYFRIELAGSDPRFVNVAQVELAEPNDDERATACLFGLPAVVERNATTDPLAIQWRQSGGEQFRLLAGNDGHIDTGACEQLFRALVAFLLRAGLVTAGKLADAEDDLHYFGASQGFVVRAAAQGMFVTHLTAGRWVQAGDLVGQIFDAGNGALLETVKAPVGGMVGAIRCFPDVHRGDALCELLSLRPIPEALKAAEQAH